MLKTIRMLKDESLYEFYAKLCNISNQAFALNEEYSNVKMVYKVLRLCLNHFFMKVIIIEDPKYIDTMSIDEIIKSFQSFAMNLK
ncbi:hypothetical protein J1N35_014508, partial [Gossypium stocksii]